MTWPENVYTQPPSSSNADEHGYGSDFPLFRVPSASCQLSLAGTNPSWGSALVLRVNHCTRSIELLACPPIRPLLLSTPLSHQPQRSEISRGSKKKRSSKKNVLVTLILFWFHSSTSKRLLRRRIGSHSKSTHGGIRLKTSNRPVRSRVALNSFPFTHNRESWSLYKSVCCVPR